MRASRPDQRIDAWSGPPSPASPSRSQARPPVTARRGTHVRDQVRVWGFGLALIALFSGFAYYRVADPPVTGDEPHYLVYARSLTEGWGLDLSRAHRLENTEPFYIGELGPHGRRYAGPDGRLASWHGIGLPVLIAPALKVEMSVWAGRWVMILIYSLLIYQLFRLITTLLTDSYRVAAVSVLIVALAPPLIVYSGQIFPETAGAVLIVVALRALVSNRSLWIRVGGASIAGSLLPWFNIRYVTLTAVLLLLALIVALRERPPLRQASRPLLALSIPAALIGGSLIAFNLELYGRLAPALEVVEAGSYFRPEYLYEWGVGGVLGVPNGLIPHAPVLAVALVAVPLTAKLLGTPRLLAGVGLILVYVGFNAFFGSPGFAPSGRYFVSVVPLLAVPLAGGLVLGGWSVRLSLVVLGVLTALSTATSATHFGVLYSNSTDGLQPADATAAAYPFTQAEYPAPGVTTEAGQIPHDIGRLRRVEGRSTLVARSSKDAPGALAYGPYATLRPGRYVARFMLWMPAAAARRTTAVLDIVEAGGDELAHRWIQALPSGRTMIVVPFTTHGQLPIEMRVFFHRGILGVQSVEAKILQPLPTRRLTDELWKALAWIAGLSAVALFWYARSRKSSRIHRS
jgi:hypothetical protein